MGAMGAMNAITTAQSMGLAPDIPFSREDAAKIGRDLTTWWGFLKMYFHVTNRFVLNRLRVIAFPFRTDHRRCATDAKEGYDYCDAYDDTNAMDLYVPCIALITYVLLSAGIMGASGEFKPEVLGSQTSWCLAVAFLEVCVIQGLALSFGATSKVCLRGRDTVLIFMFFFLGGEMTLVEDEPSWKAVQ